MTEGVWDKVKGMANEAVGDLRADDAQRERGKAQQAKGEYEQRARRASELERERV